MLLKLTVVWMERPYCRACSSQASGAGVAERNTRSAPMKSRPEALSPASSLSATSATLSTQATLSASASTNQRSSPLKPSRRSNLNPSRH
ncbi:hypothetical protein D3C79_745090 [compost metagenome]